MRIIQGQWKGRRIEAPSSPTTRPTSDRLRETIFSSLYSALTRQGRTLEGLKVLDLFAGSGALGFEALSRGAHHVTFVEQNPQAYRCIRQSIETLKAQERCLLLRADVLSLRPAAETYDLIFSDPPYNHGLSQRTLSKLEQDHFCAPDTIVILETALEEDLNPLPSTWVLLSHRPAGRAGLWMLQKNPL